MALVTLAEAKAQCRVTNNLEDDLITLYMNAADEWIAEYLNRDAAPVRYRTKAAALLLIQDMHKNRGAMLDEKQYKNPGVESLLYPLRRGIGI